MTSERILRIEFSTIYTDSFIFDMPTGDAAMAPFSLLHIQASPADPVRIPLRHAGHEQIGIDVIGCEK
jgi:hypothetical protein